MTKWAMFEGTQTKSVQEGEFFGWQHALGVTSVSLRPTGSLLLCCNTVELSEDEELRFIAEHDFRSPLLYIA